MKDGPLIFRKNGGGKVERCYPAGVGHRPVIGSASHAARAWGWTIALMHEECMVTAVIMTIEGVSNECIRENLFTAWIS